MTVVFAAWIAVALAVVSYGVWMVYTPAGVIAAGLSLGLVGCLLFVEVGE